MVRDLEVEKFVDDEEEILHSGRIVAVEFKDATDHHTEKDIGAIQDDAETSDTAPAIVTVEKWKYEIIEYSQRVACPLSAWEARGMKPYSKDLRLRVLAAVDRGMGRKEVSETFGVSEPTVRRYLQLRRESGRVDPRPPSGPPARKGRALEAALPPRSRATPTSRWRITASSSRTSAA